MVFTVMPDQSSLRAGACQQIELRRLIALLLSGSTSPALYALLRDHGDPADNREYGSRAAQPVHRRSPPLPAVRTLYALKRWNSVRPGITGLPLTFLERATG